MDLLKPLLQIHLFCFFTFHLLVTIQGWEDSSAHNHLIHKHGPKPKLFVFGDSYADTGNIRKSLSTSWKQPYGLTFPGKPAGRFSDGRVLTDYIDEQMILDFLKRGYFILCIAKSMGIKSPTPYQWKDFAKKRLHYGMNFAYGGTGVFDTNIILPNMTTQIGFLEKLLISDSVYVKDDLQSSLVLVTLSGNDYSHFYTTGGTAQGLQSFITQVVNQLALNLKRIEAMGARRIAVTGLQPLGCLPRATAASAFQQCNKTENTAVNFHNLLLQQAVAKLNNESNSRKPVFTILDLYTSFTTALKNTGNHPGNMTFQTPLKPCCVGISSENFCGSLDDKGVKLYSVCENPESAFFWDTAHPTQAGWHAVYYSSLKATLEQSF